MKRRQFLAAAGAGALTVTLAGCSLVPVIPKRPTSTADDALGWIRYENGRYTLWLPSAEMGQQISAALQGLATAELGVPPAQVHLQLPSTRHIARVRATVGSASVQDFALPLARACATLREALAQGQTTGTLAARDIPASALRSLQPRAGGAQEAAAAPGQLRAIVTGQPLFAGDTRLPGLLYGRVLRAPVSAEIASRPQAWDEAAARADPACVAVVQHPRLLQVGSLGLGIVARRPSALDRIEAALAVQWQVDEGRAFIRRPSTSASTSTPTCAGARCSTACARMTCPRTPPGRWTCAWTSPWPPTHPSSPAAPRRTGCPLQTKASP